MGLLSKIGQPVLDAVPKDVFRDVEVSVDDTIAQSGEFVPLHLFHATGYRLFEGCGSTTAGWGRTSFAALGADPFLATRVLLASGPPAPPYTMSRCPVILLRRIPKGKGNATHQHGRPCRSFADSASAAR